MLRGCLHGHSAHGRAQGSLGHGLRVSRVVLLPLHERLHVDWGDEPDVMAKTGEFAAPVVGSSAGLHRHDAGRQRRHELRKLQPRQLLAEQYATVGRGPVHLKNLLCQIDPDDANLFHGCLLPLW